MATLDPRYPAFMIASIRRRWPWILALLGAAALLAAACGGGSSPTVSSELAAWVNGICGANHEFNDRTEAITLQFGDFQYSDPSDLPVVEKIFTDFQEIADQFTEQLMRLSPPPEAAALHALTLDAAQRESIVIERAVSRLALAQTNVEAAAAILSFVASRDSVVGEADSVVARFDSVVAELASIEAEPGSFVTEQELAAIFAPLETIVPLDSVPQLAQALRMSAQCQQLTEAVS